MSMKQADVYTESAASHAHLRPTEPGVELVPSSSNADATSGEQRRSPASSSSAHEDSRAIDPRRTRCNNADS
jgi:hypothetical protein